MVLCRERAARATTVNGCSTRHSYDLCPVRAWFSTAGLPAGPKLLATACPTSRYSNINEYQMSQNSRNICSITHAHCPYFVPALCLSLSMPSTAILVSMWQCSHGRSALAGPSTRQNPATGGTSRGASAQTPEPAHTSSSAQALDATQHQSLNAAASAGTEANATGAAAASQPAGQQQQQQQASSDSQGASGSRQDADAGSAGRGGDGRRQRRTRRPAISPAVTMALGSLLQSTLQGDAYRDPAGVLTHAAQLLLNSHSFEGDNRQQVLVGLPHSHSCM